MTAFEIDSLEELQLHMAERGLHSDSMVGDRALPRFSA